MPPSMKLLFNSRLSYVLIRCACVVVCGPHLTQNILAGRRMPMQEMVILDPNHAQLVSK